MSISALIRRGLLSLLLVAAMAATPTTAPLVAQSAENARYAAIVVDAESGEVLFSRFADQRRFPASITKMMTLYLTFEALTEGKAKLDDVLTVSAHAASQPPSKLGLGAGQTITLDNAMRATAVRSANDMAVALAEHIGGSEDRFTAQMTRKARELGMTQTQYVNANGLPDSRQLTSARDLAVLARAIMRDYPQYYRYFGLHDWAYNGRDYRNTNGLLRGGAGYDGMKTGYTNASGYNLAGSAVRDGRRLIAVVLGGSSTAWRDNNMEDLLLTGFEVLKRRAHGDRTTIAANLYENEPNGPIMRPSTEQGDGEQSGLKIVLTDSPRAKPVKVSPTLKAAKTATKPVKKPKGEWAVQVGAFKSKGLANKQLTLVRGRYAKFVADAEGAVEGVSGGAFRAQFQGLTAEAARSACKAITAKRQPCMVLSPG